MLAAQELRSGEGKNTKFIDQALENYDALVESSGKEGITKQEFYKPYRPATVETPVPPTDPIVPTDTTTPVESELPLIEIVPPSETVLLDMTI